MSVCQVLSCKSSQDPKRTYHKFPNDPVRRKEWIVALGCKELELRSHSTICSRHFRIKDYYPGGKRLLQDAVPFLRLDKSAKTGSKQKKAILLTKLGKKDSKPNHMKTNLKAASKNKNVKPVQTVKSLLKRSTNSSDLKPKTKESSLKLSSNTSTQAVSKQKSSSKRVTPAASNKESSPIKNITAFKNKITKSTRRFNGSTQNKSKSPTSVKQVKEEINKINSLPITTQPSNPNINLHSTISLPDIQQSALETKSSNKRKSVKRISDEYIFEAQVKRSRIENQKLPFNSQNFKSYLSKQVWVNSNPQKQIESTSKLKENIQKTTKKSKVDYNITNIEQTIVEMQNKIKKLEKKSILDEKRIETFKKALLQQRKNEFKILMDEKENELLLRMDLLYLDYDPQRICRLCLLLVDKKESLTSLVWPIKNQALMVLIKNTTNILIEPDDGMPSGICKECLQQIKRVDWIRRRSQRSNMLIKKFITMKKGVNETNTTGNEKQQFNDDLFEEEVSEVFKIEDVFSLENSPESVQFDMVVKQEPDSDEDINKSSRNQELSVKVNTKTLVKNVQKCKGCGTVFTNCWSLNNHFKYCHKKYQCSECSKCFWNSKLFRMHKQRQQVCSCAEMYRSCYDCQIVFRWKWQLVFHVLQHSPQPCGLCDEILHSIDHLKAHITESH